MSNSASSRSIAFENARTTAAPDRAAATAAGSARQSTVGVAEGKRGTPAGADADVEAPTLVERPGIVGEQAAQTRERREVPEGWRHILLDHDHLGGRLKFQPGQHRLKIGPACWIVGRAVGYDVGCRLQTVRLYRVRALDRE